MPNRYHVPAPNPCPPPPWVMPGAKYLLLLCVEVGWGTGGYLLAHS